eukprot:3860316-Rhodomonas_salina.3
MRARRKGRLDAEPRASCAVHGRAGGGIWGGHFLCARAELARGGTRRGFQLSIADHCCGGTVGSVVLCHLVASLLFSYAIAVQSVPC